MILRDPQRAAMSVRRLLVLLLLCGVGAGCRGAGADTAVVVAGGDSPEQVLLGALTMRALEEQGYRVVDRTSLGSPWMVRRALEADSVDLCWEYTGDTWMVHLGHDRPISDPAEAYERVRAEDAARGIIWLPPAPCQHTMGLVMRRSEALSFGIVSIGDLAGYVGAVDPFMPLCTPEEFYNLAGGVRGIERVYGMRFSPEHLIYGSIEEGYGRAAQGECLSAVGYSLDVGLVANDLVVLADDRGFFQASSLAVAVRAPILEALPGLDEDLGRLSALLASEAMAAMLREVTIEGEKPQKVVRRFLAEQGELRW